MIPRIELERLLSRDDSMVDRFLSESAGLAVAGA
jgi:hypothetical protein